MADKTRIYVVEDDEEIRLLLESFLGQAGYSVETVASGAALTDLVMRSGLPDLLLLDWMLPGEDGLAICRRFRALGSTPIIMVTAKDEEIDAVLGLEMGADDYVTKPFGPRELLARVRAVLRRTAEPADPAAPKRFGFADLVMDLDARSVTVRNSSSTLPLTSAEFELLKCFITRPQRVLSRDQLLDWTRGRVADVFDRSIDVQVSRLRRKLERSEVGPGHLIKTVRNVGYIFTVPVRQV